MDIRQVESDLSSLERLTEALNEHPQNPNPQDEVDKIRRKLRELKEHTQDGLPETMSNLKQRTVQVLTDLNRSLRASQINDLAKETLQLRQEIETSVAIGLKIAVFSDFDCPDHNSAISLGLEEAIKKGVPFITTRSLLKGTGVEEGPWGRYPSTGLHLEDVLYEHENQWDIFQSGELVVFLPKSLASEHKGIDKLKTLDFVGDGSLKPATLSQVLQGSAGKARFEDFNALFSTNPQINKVFYLGGHGTSDFVGALNQDHYEQFLGFLDRQRCKGMIIFSCYAGGQSSLLLTSPQNTSENPGFENSAAHHAFPTIAFSIGDFPSYTMSEGILSQSLDQLSAFVANTRNQTAARLRESFKSMGALNAKSVNLMKVYFPSSKGVPQGMSAVNEDKKALSYTHAQQEARYLEHKALEVQGKEFLEVHPLVTKAPIEIQGEAPVLISMIPGQGHHYFKEVRLTEKTVESFFDKTIQFNQENIVSEHYPGVNKAYFFEKIVSKDKIVEKAVLFTTPAGSKYLYQQGNIYYLADSSGTQKISRKEYELLCLQIKQQTTPSSEALQASTRGHETEEMFNQNFSGFSIDSNLDFLRKKQLEDFINNQQLTESEARALVFYLVQQKRGDFASMVLSKYNLSPDIRDLWGTPLLCLAVLRENSYLVQFLVKQRCDVNAQQQVYPNNGALHLALALRSSSILKILLQDQRINVNLLNAHKESPYSMVWILDPTWDAFQTIKNKGGSLFPEQSHVLLASATKDKNKELAQSLLDVGIDPMQGNPSAFETAIRENNLDFVQMFQTKGNLFTPNGYGRVPFIEAILHGSHQVVSELLSQPGCKVNAQDGEGLTPLVAALSTGEPEKIEAVLKAGGSIPYPLSNMSQELLKHAMRRLGHLGYIEILEKFLKSSSPDVANFCMNALDPHIQVELIRRGIPNTAE